MDFLILKAAMLRYGTIKNKRIGVIMEENNSALSAKDKLQIEEIAKNLDLSSTQSSVQFASAVQSSLSKPDRISKAHGFKRLHTGKRRAIDELLEIA